MDLATALTMFWMAEPDYYQEFESRSQVPEWAVAGWDFVQSLLERIARGDFEVGRARFDADEFVSSGVNGPTCKWHIPEDLCRSVEPAGTGS